MSEKGLLLSVSQTAECVMIGIGGFAPLTGFQGSVAGRKVCGQMRSSDGE
ncbi:MAG: hypothetical protein ACKOL0_05255 [Solirubrobacterales bacterium]